MNSSTARQIWPDRLANGTWFVVICSAFLIALLEIGWLVAFLTLLVMVCSCMLIRKTAAPFHVNGLSISGFWYMTYLAMIFFPAFFVFADQETHPARVPYLFAVESVLITVPLGALWVSQLMSFRMGESKEYFDGPMVGWQVTSSFTKKYQLLLMVPVAFTLIYMRQVDTIPLFYLIQNPGDYIASAFLREESFKLMDSPLMYVYFLIRGTVYPLLIGVSFGCYKWTKSKKWFWLFIATFAAGAFFASLSIAKKPVATIFLVLSLFVYFYRHRSITIKQTTGFFCLIFLFPVLVVSGLKAGTDIDAGDVASALADRLLYGPSEVVYYYFEVFPDHVGYLHGRSISKLALITGAEVFDTANYVGRYGYPQYIESINCNGAFISDLNADFGLSGVLVGGVLAGAIMQGLHIFLVRRRKTVVSLACYSFLVYEFWDLNSTSLPTVLASNGALLAVCVALLLERWIFSSKSSDDSIRVQAINVSPEFQI